MKSSTGTRAAAAEDMALRVGDALIAGRVIRVDRSSTSHEWLCRGVHEVKWLVLRGIPRARIWTLVEISSGAGALWSAQTTLAEVVRAFGQMPEEHARGSVHQ